MNAARDRDTLEPRIGCATHANAPPPMRKPLLVITALGGAVLAVILRRRKAEADAALWREATSDTSR